MMYYQRTVEGILIDLSGESFNLFKTSEYTGNTQVIIPSNITPGLYTLRIKVFAEIGYEVSDTSDVLFSIVAATTTTTTTTSIVYRIYTHQITPNKLYLSTYGDFSGGPDAACKNLGYSNGSTGKYECKKTDYLSSAGYCVPNQLNYRDKGVWKVFDINRGYTFPYCITNGQSWCIDNQYLEWVECRGPISVGQNSTSVTNQMASVLQSATQILVDIFNYLTR